MAKKKIFSGLESENMWRKINSSNDIEKLRDAVYFLGCKCQELESEVIRLRKQLVVVEIIVGVVIILASLIFCNK